MESERVAVTCDGRLFHRRVAATGNALLPTVDRRVCRTSREVDEAEHKLLYNYIMRCNGESHNINNQSI